MHLCTDWRSSLQVPVHLQPFNIISGDGKKQRFFSTFLWTHFVPYCLILKEATLETHDNPMAGDFFLSYLFLALSLFTSGGNFKIFTTLVFISILFPKLSCFHLCMMQPLSLRSKVASVRLCWPEGTNQTLINMCSGPLVRVMSAAFSWLYLWL